MKRRLKSMPDKTGNEHLTCHLGYDGLARIDRLVQLLQEEMTSSRRITRSEVVRVALGRLLLAVLAQRARPDDAKCPWMEEYLRVMDALTSADEYHVPVTFPARPGTDNPGRSKNQGPRRRKTP